MIFKRFLIGLVIFMMTSSIAYGGKNIHPSVTFDQSISTSQDSVTPTPIPPVTRNEDWTPQEQDFDGVTMVLVPAGCFMMGSTEEQVNEAYSMYVSDFGESPNVLTTFEAELTQHEQCFDTSFWIDKYEVSQAQFIQFEGQKARENRNIGDDLPVENITWFEASDFCELRGGRLPTEAEWEYVARGPNNLIYPWGDEFIADNVTYRENSYANTDPVGSREDGASWVGAMDMSGNVFEWVSSLYLPYPYSIDSEDITDTESERTFRGGAVTGTPDLVRSTVRLGYAPDTAINITGMRCVRSE